MNTKHILLTIVSIVSAIPQFSSGSSVQQQKQQQHPDWKKYVMTGSLATTTDTNKGLIYDQRAPRLTFTFEDKNKNRAQATFQCTLHSVTLMGGISVNVYAARMSGNHITLQQAFDAPIKFGPGIKLSMGLPILWGFPLLDTVLGVGIWLSHIKQYGGCFCMLDLGCGPYIQFPIAYMHSGQLEMIGKPIFIDADADEEDEPDKITKNKAI